MTENNDKKNVTLHLNSKLYDDYSEYCKKEGIVLSRQIEKFIETRLTEKNRKNNHAKITRGSNNE